MKRVAKTMFIILLTVVLGCKEEKPLYDQVMDIHDEVMPEMDKLYQLKKGIQVKLADSVNLNPVRSAELEQTVKLLDSASTAMMVWMREYNPPEDKESEAFQKYMENELVRVKQMREVVKSALEKGKTAD